MVNVERNKKIEKLTKQDVSEISGGTSAKMLYIGNTPNFNHPIKSKFLSKQFKHKIDDKDLFIQE